MEDSTALKNPITLTYNRLRVKVTRDLAASYRGKMTSDEGDAVEKKQRPVTGHVVDHVGKRTAAS